MRTGIYEHICLHFQKGHVAVWLLCIDYCPDVPRAEICLCLWNPATVSCQPLLQCTEMVIPIGSFTASSSLHHRSYPLQQAYVPLPPDSRSLPSLGRLSGFPQPSLTYWFQTCFLVTKSCLNLWDSHGLQPASLLCPWDFPGKNSGVGCHFLLQRDLSSPGLEPASPAMTGRFFTAELPGKPASRLEWCKGAKQWNK